MEEDGSHLTEGLLKLALEFVHHLLSGEVRRTLGGHITDRMLHLTLRITYLLAGEMFPNVKSGGELKVMVPSGPCLIPKRGNRQKILEVTNKITELLMGEEEEVRHLEGQKNHEEEVQLEGQKDQEGSIMMEDDKISPDHQGRRPTDGEIVTSEITDEEEEETWMTGDDEEEEETGMTGDSQTTEEDVLLTIKEEEEIFVEGGHKELYKKDRMEDQPPDGAPPEGWTAPLNSQDFIWKDHTYTQHDWEEEEQTLQGETKEETCVRGDQQEEGDILRIIKVEEEEILQTTEERDMVVIIKGEEEEETCVRGDQLTTEEGDIRIIKLEVDETSMCGDPQTLRDGDMMGTIKVEEEEVCVEGAQQITSEAEDIMETSEEEDMIGTSEEEDILRTSEEEESSLDSSTDEENRLDNVSSYSKCGKSPTAESVSITLGGGTRQPSTAACSFLCSKCGKAFSQYRHLLRHQKRHTRKRPFSCSECGKLFIEERDLLRHQRAHNGDTGPFSCSECGKTLSNYGNLLRHEKIHTGERPYSCSECGKGFIEKRGMLQHQRTHTGERPFSCSECGKAYMGKQALDLHQKKHHC